MKFLFSILFCIPFSVSLAQSARKVTFGTSAHFNIAQDGLGTNDVGIGLGLDASVFSNHKLQLLIASDIDQFIGDKLLEINPATGEHAKTRPMYTIKAGPQFLIGKRISVSVTYGPVWHQIRDFAYTLDYGFNYGITGFAGSNRKLVLKGFLVNIATSEQDIRYFGFGIGYRL